MQIAPRHPGLDLEDHVNRVRQAVALLKLAADGVRFREENGSPDDHPDALDALSLHLERLVESLDENVSASAKRILEDARITVQQVPK